MKIGDEIYVHGYVDEIRKNCVIVRNKGGYFGTVQEEISEAIPPIDLREMDLWIPVSKELPIDYTLNLVTYIDEDVNFPIVDIAFYRDKQFHSEDFERLNVLAWMPLPKPYEVKEE